MMIYFSYVKWEFLNFFTVFFMFFYVKVGIIVVLNHQKTYKTTKKHLIFQPVWLKSKSNQT